MSTAEKELSNINPHPSSEVEGERIRTEGRNENTNDGNKEKSEKKGKRSISNPRRLLILTPTPHSTKIIPPFLLGLTGEAVNSENIITTITTAETTATSSTSTAPSTNQSILNAQREEEQQLDIDTGNGGRDGRTITATDSRTTISFAGYTTHAPFRIDNKYYKTEVGIWVDEVPLSVPTSSNFNYLETNTRITTPLPQREMEDEQEERRDGREAMSSAASVLNTDIGPTLTHTPTPIYSSLSSWKTEFLGGEAREVRNAIGAVVLCVLNPSLNAPPHDHNNHHVGLQGPAARTTSSSSLIVSHREDVRAIKELIHMIGEVKNKIEEERGDGEEEAGVGGDVPSLLVIVGESSKHQQSQPASQTAPRATRDLEDEVEETLDFEVFGTDWWEEEIYNMGLYGFEVVAWDPKSDSFPGEEKRNIYGGEWCSLFLSFLGQSS
jgi:hypothetical protein